MASEQRQNALYGRTRRCAECGCEDPTKLNKAQRRDYSPHAKRFVVYEALECAKCGSVSAL